MTSLPDAPEYLPVRWERSRTRLIAGLAVIALGVAATTLSSTYSLLFLAIGPVVQAAGWLLLPGALWRRMIVLLPCMLAGLILLGGVDFVGAFAVLLGGWLVARSRPAVSYLALLLPIAASLGVKASLHDYGHNLMGLGIGTVATIAGAWLAAALHGRRLHGRRSGRSTEQIR